MHRINKTAQVPTNNSAGIEATATIIKCVKANSEFILVSKTRA